MIRKFYFTILFLFLLQSVMAKRTPNHLMFQNIPITGTEKQMKDSLHSHGFRWGMDGLRIKGYIGLVAGKEMVVTIHVTPESNVVYSLVAHGKRHRKWEDLKKEYLDIKALCRKKYGRPVSHSERFHRLVMGKNSKKRAVRQGKCDYQCSFRVKNGTIIVYVDNDRRVCIEYQDEENAALNEEEILREL